MSLLCPFGDDPVDLSSKTLDRKKWFAQQLLGNLKKGKICYKIVIPFPGKLGRPPLWDNSALEALSGCVQFGE